MNLIDKIQKSIACGDPLPLKGHAKITLTDVYSGKKDVIESDNIVTNAVADILARNFSGLADFHLLMPLKKLFGGVMCFQNSIDQQASNFNPPNDVFNPMIAHAGDEAHTTASTLRGNPNGGETVITDTAIKQVWDWATNQGNGTISTVCLCPNNMGNVGLKPFDGTQSLYKPMAVLNDSLIGNLSVTRDIAKKFPISINSDGTEGKCIWWSGQDFEEITVKHDWTKFGVLRSHDDFIEVSSRSTTVRELPPLKSHITEDEDFYYCYAVIAYNQISITKISKDTFLTENIDLTVSDVFLFSGDYNVNLSDVNRLIPRYASDGHYVFLPSANSEYFIGVNFNNGADSLVCSGSCSINTSSAGTGVSDAPMVRPVAIGQRPTSGLIVGENYIINGSVCYPLAYSQDCVGVQTGYKQAIVYDMIRQGCGVWASGIPRGQASSRAGQGPVLLPVFLSTINTLQSAVVKTSSQTMKIEYTLTEA